MTGESQLLERSPARIHLLAATWWFACPASAVVIVRMLADRACGDAYNLLPALAADPRWAWPAALVYAAGHVWFVAAYLVTADSAGTLAPGISALKAVWGRHTAKVALMTVLFLLEYSPIGLWRSVGVGIGCP